MTSTVVAREGAGDGSARRPAPRHYLMCPPTYFDVVYAINPWMDPRVPVDRDRALAQWSALVAAYRAHGHRVDLLDPVPGLPDLVFTANGATVVDGHVLRARFANSERSAEARIHEDWHRLHGILYGGTQVQRPVAVNEAEGDFAVLSDTVLAGYGFRTSRAAHRELAALTGREVLGLRLVDPRFYHLDVALAVLDDRTDHVAYYPEAFSLGSQKLLAERFPDALLVSETDALAFGLNCVSDGFHVFVPVQAPGLVASLEAAGYQPVPLDLSELTRAGGSIKCCTQEVRPVALRPTHDPQEN
ncbi:N-dimethylarginine dimethylaminohydrolase [Marmoricola sp. OAE513]|uniref:dimethylargininase n=1 Tax=Marmoricola sp. OAE513 TaxID=2817894 RepID=UPI001AE72737